MIVACHPMQTLGPGRDGIAVAGFALEQRKIELATVQRVTQLDTEIAADVEPETRPRAHELRQQRGEAASGEVLRNAEPHQALANRPRHDVARLLGERENA